MGRAEFRQAIFDLVEYYTQYELSDRAKQLVLHYFNDSKEGTSYDRALDAIARYYANDIPEYEEGGMPARLKKMMVLLRREADAWDMD